MSSNYLSTSQHGEVRDGGLDLGNGVRDQRFEKFRVVVVRSCWMNEFKQEIKRN